MLTLCNLTIGDGHKNQLPLCQVHYKTVGVVVTTGVELTLFSVGTCGRLG